jgi:hypothetical protein
VPGPSTHRQVYVDSGDGDGIGYDDERDNVDEEFVNAGDDDDTKELSTTAAIAADPRMAEKLAEAENEVGCHPVRVCVCVCVYVCVCVCVHSSNH